MIISYKSVAAVKRGKWSSYGLTSLAVAVKIPIFPILPDMLLVATIWSMRGLADVEASWLGGEGRTIREEFSLIQNAEL